MLSEIPCDQASFARINDSSFFSNSKHTRDYMPSVSECAGINEWFEQLFVRQRSDYTPDKRRPTSPKTEPRERSVC